ncbi:hypothetical protein AB4212_39670 [Streptomyces sp. 2MCAF27]
MRWARSSAGPRRLLWVAAILLGLVYAHGVSADAIAGHLAPRAATSVTAVEHSGASGSGVTGGTVYVLSEDAVPDHHHDGHEAASHPAHGCVLGQPQQTPDLNAPTPAPLDRQKTCRQQSLGEPGLTVTTSAEPSPRGSTGSAALRI